MSYSKDFRECILKSVGDGLPVTLASDRFGVSCRTIYNWLGEAAGKLKPKRGSGIVGRPYAIKDVEEFRAYVKQNADKPQREMAVELGVSKMAICRMLKRIGFSYKKNIQLSRTGRRRSDSVS